MKFLFLILLIFFWITCAFASSQKKEASCIPTDTRFALDPIGINNITLKELEFIVKDKISFKRLKKEIGLPDRIHRKGKYLTGFWVYGTRTGSRGNNCISPESTTYFVDVYVLEILFLDFRKRDCRITNKTYIQGELDIDFYKDEPAMEKKLTCNEFLEKMNNHSRNK